MAVTVTENLESRRVSTGAQPIAELHFSIHDVPYTDDEHAVALAALLDPEVGAPMVFYPWKDSPLYLPRDESTVKPIGEGLWEGTVRYALNAQLSSFSFDTTGGMQHITQNLSTSGQYGPLGLPPPDCYGVIGSTPDGVEGVDIPVPVYVFSETHSLADAIVVPPGNEYGYRSALRDLTARVNDEPFRGCLAGECIFLGAFGIRQGESLWNITFRFAAAPNVVNRTVPSPLGNITGIAKSAWDYLEVKYLNKVVANRMTMVPYAVYVHRVSYWGNFGVLGI